MKKRIISWSTGFIILLWFFFYTLSTMNFQGPEAEAAGGCIGFKLVTSGGTPNCGSGWSLINHVRTGYTGQYCDRSVYIGLCALD